MPVPHDRGPRQPTRRATTRRTHHPESVLDTGESEPDPTLGSTASTAAAVDLGLVYDYDLLGEEE